MTDEKLAEIERWGPRFEGLVCRRHNVNSCPSCLSYALGDAQEQVRRLNGILHDADATPLAEVASEMAALRENVAGVAALLEESQEEVRALTALLERSRAREKEALDMVFKASTGGARRMRERCAKAADALAAKAGSDGQEAMAGEIADAIRALPDAGPEET